MAETTKRDPIEVATIRHPVGADGTMRYRFTFRVSVDPTIRGKDSDLGRMFMGAMERSLRAGMRELPPITDPDAEFQAGYDAGFGDTGEGDNAEWSRRGAEGHAARCTAALAAHRAKQDAARPKPPRSDPPPGHEHTGFCPECHGKPEDGHGGG